MMKKQIAVVCMSGALILSLGACGKTATAQDTTAKSTMETTVKAMEETTIETAATAKETTEMAATETPKTEMETGTLISGSISEVKDFMFILDAENGESYVFSIESKDVLGGAKVGDKVSVSYEGSLDAGADMSVLKVEKSK